MKLRTVLLVLPLLAVSVASGCSRTAGARPTSTSPSTRPSSRGPDVVHLAGVRDIRFGDTEAELNRRGALTAVPESCGPRLADITAVSPVFADGRLVLLWVDPPMRTPEGVSVGTAISEVRTAYPTARELTAPPGTYRFDGLMAAQGDRAYLFLHDGQTVRKTIAGYSEFAQRLFDGGFGTC